jgi:hypothetical protein
MARLDGKVALITGATMIRTPRPRRAKSAKSAAAAPV